MTCYETLGVGRKARLTDIKKAYRRLARKHHPDLNPGDKSAADRFKRITEAYETLSDTGKRKQYDHHIDLGIPWQGAAAGHAGGPSAWNPGAGFTGGLSDLFSDILGGRRAARHNRRAPRQGDDITQPLEIPFFDALRGTTVELALNTESTCSRCNGSGAVSASTQRPCPECAGTGQVSHHAGVLRFASPCRRCDGEGTLGWAGCGSCGGAGVTTRRETIKVHIPAGVATGSRVRVQGKGRAGRNGGRAGDLYIITHVSAHPYFRRIGDNIHCTVPITVTEAALGTRIEVPTIDGSAKIRIPPGTGNGQQFRLRGKGAPSLRGRVRGDHYVEAEIRTPPTNDERTRELLRSLGELHSGETLRREMFERPSRPSGG
jgi:molecular chaperone DnaJ